LVKVKAALQGKGNGRITFGEIPDKAKAKGTSVCSGGHPEF